MSKRYQEVERSPDGRYIRFDKKIGVGAYKSVWLAYDTEKGIEVAWNTVILDRLPPKEQARLRGETDILKGLYHPNVIEFYHVWNNPEKKEILFTTEIMSSGTLKEYTTRTKDRIKLKVIKKWCRQILNGLMYLHTRSPPVIHRDLKCDNIFINGNTADIRIGDLGLSTQKGAAHLVSVLGTPEFMAPELYEESYTEKVDIYAFGMCLLEMCTNEYPYQECANPAQIYKKVTKSIKPAVLSRIIDEQVRGFISLCLDREELRLSASELLEHPFLAFKSCELRDNYPVHFEGPDEDEDEKDIDLSNETDQLPPDSVPTVTSNPVISVENFDVSKADLALKLQYGDRRRVVKFQYDFESDTAHSIASEMVTELKLPDSELKLIADSVESIVEKLTSAESPSPSVTTEQPEPNVAEPPSSDMKHERADRKTGEARYQTEETPYNNDDATFKSDDTTTAFTKEATVFTNLNEFDPLMDDTKHSEEAASTKLPNTTLTSSECSTTCESPISTQPHDSSSDTAHDELVQMTLKENLEKLKVKELKRRIEELGSDSAHCIEKSDLVETCLRLEMQTQKNRRQTPIDASLSDHVLTERIQMPQDAGNYSDQHSYSDQPSSGGISPSSRDTDDQLASVFGAPSTKNSSPPSTSPSSHRDPSLPELESATTTQETENSNFQRETNVDPDIHDDTLASVFGDPSTKSSSPMPSPPLSRHPSLPDLEMASSSQELEDSNYQLESNVDMDVLSSEDRKRLEALLNHQKQKLKRMYEKTKEKHAQEFRDLESKLIKKARKKHKKKPRASDPPPQTLQGGLDDRPDIKSLDRRKSEKRPAKQYNEKRLSKQPKEKTVARDETNSKKSVSARNRQSIKRTPNTNGKRKERKLKDPNKAKKIEVDAKQAELKLMSQFQIDIAKDGKSDSNSSNTGNSDTSAVRSFRKRGSRDPMSPSIDVSNGI